MRRRFALASAIAIVLVCVVVAAPVFGFATKGSKSVSVPSLEVGTTTATCPAHQHLEFAGLKAQFHPPPQSGPLLFPTGMRRTADGQLTVDAQSFTDHGSSRLTAIAYCGNASVPVKATNTTQIKNGVVGSVVAKCPAGKVVVGAGFASQHGYNHTHIFTDLERIAPDKVRLSAIGLFAYTTAITAIAYCGAGPAPQLSSKTVAVPEGHGATARVTCPKGTSLVFGGEITTASNLAGSPSVLAFNLTADTEREWSVGGYNAGNATGHITALAYCR